MPGSFNKLEAAAEKWIADGHFSSREEIDQAATDLITARLATDRAEIDALKKQIVDEITLGLEQIERGETISFDSAEEMLAHVKARSEANRRTGGTKR